MEYAARGTKITVPSLLPSFLEEAEVGEPERGNMQMERLKIEINTLSPTFPEEAEVAEGSRHGV